MENNENMHETYQKRKNEWLNTLNEEVEKLFDERYSQFGIDKSQYLPIKTAVQCTVFPNVYLLLFRNTSLQISDFLNKDPKRVAEKYLEVVIEPNQIVKGLVKDFDQLINRFPDSLEVKNMKERLKTFKGTLLKDMEEKSPGLVHGLPYFEKFFQTKMELYDEKISRIDEKVTGHIDLHKHQETLSLSKRQINLAIIAIICAVILSAVSLYFTFNPP